MPTACPQVKQHLYEQNIGNYKLTSKVLGNGTKSQVKLGYSNTLNRNVAIKVINTKEISEGERKLVEQESKILRKVSEINNSQYTSYLDTIEDEENIYIVTELINGVELIDFCAGYKGGMPEGLVKKIFLQIAQSVSQLHQNNICHLDLKLENIMYIRYLNRVKLIDFGFSNITRSDDLSDDLLQTHYCGTLHYTPPEVLREQPYDGKKADAWSLGVLLHCMLTLAYPFDDLLNNNFSVISEMITDEVPFSSPYSIPSSAHSLIQSLLTKNPSDRISVSEILSHPWFS